MNDESVSYKSYDGATVLNTFVCLFVYIMLTFSKMALNSNLYVYPMSYQKSVEWNF